MGEAPGRGPCVRGLLRHQEAVAGGEPGAPGRPPRHGRVRKSRFSVAEVRRPLEAARAGEAQVGAERVAHRVDEPLGASRREAVLPPDVEHLHAGVGPVDPRLDPADEAVAEERSAARTSPSGASPAAGRAPTRSRSRTGSRGGRGPRPTRRTGEGTRRRAAAPAALPAARRPRARTKRLPRTPSTSTGTSSPRSTSSSRSAVRPGCPATADPASRGRYRRRCLRRRRRRAGRGRGIGTGACAGVAPRSGTSRASRSAGSSRSRRS